MGVKYTYEPEGFQHCGELYLPDFYVDTWEVFIEIKPMMVLDKRAEEYERAKYWQNEMDANGLEMVIMFGQPNRDIVVVLCDRGMPYDDFGTMYPISCRHCKGLCYHNDDGTCYGDIGKHSALCYPRETYLRPEYDERMIAAKKAVESERFGERSRRPEPEYWREKR